MRLGNFEEWCVNHTEWLKTQKFNLSDIVSNKHLTEEEKENRKSIHDKFPHIVTVQGDYGYFDLAEAWLWDNFGPSDGKCLDYCSEYPRCPLAFPLDEEGFSSKPEPHSHEGVWTMHWLRKTGYDYGFGDFCFKDLESKEKFIGQVAVYTKKEDDLLGYLKRF